MHHERKFERFSRSKANKKRKTRIEIGFAVPYCGHYGSLITNFKFVNFFLHQMI